jgi:hypothetical protein
MVFHSAFRVIRGYSTGSGSSTHMAAAAAVVVATTGWTVHEDNVRIKSRHRASRIGMNSDPQQAICDEFKQQPRQSSTKYSFKSKETMDRLFVALWNNRTAPSTLCDAAAVETARQEQQPKESEEPLFNGQFPARQLFIPSKPYPLWDENWDGRELRITADSSQPLENKELLRYIRKYGVTRHIILIRHGQYDETYRDDDKRILTPLGQLQAEYTGQRLAHMVGGDGSAGPFMNQQTSATFNNPLIDNEDDNSTETTAVTESRPTMSPVTLHVSGMTRAQETASVIAKYLPHATITAPDGMLNEGR